MPSNDGFKKYVEAGAVLGQVTRARAEEIVRDLVGSGEVQREHAQQWIDELVERSKKATEGIVELIRHEVSSQLESLSIDPNKLAAQVSEIIEKSAAKGRDATRSAKGAATRAAAASKAAGKAASKKVAARAGVKKKATTPAKKKAAPAKKKAATPTKKKTTATKKKAPAKKSTS